MGWGPAIFIFLHRVPPPPLWQPCLPPPPPSWDVRVGRPLLSSYMSRVREETEPHYADVHRDITEMAERRAKL